MGTVQDCGGVCSRAGAHEWLLHHHTHQTFFCIFSLSRVTDGNICMFAPLTGAQGTTMRDDPGLAADTCTHAAKRQEHASEFTTQWHRVADMCRRAASTRWNKPRSKNSMRFRSTAQWKKRQWTPWSRNQVVSSVGWSTCAQSMALTAVVTRLSLCFILWSTRCDVDLRKNRVQRNNTTENEN